MTESVFPDPVALAMNTLLAIVPQAALQMSSAFSGAAPLNHTSGACFSLLPRLHGQELPRPMATNGRAALDTQKQRHMAVGVSCMLCTDYLTIEMQNIQGASLLSRSAWHGAEWTLYSIEHLS